MQPAAQHILLFDGVCNLCNKSVQFIIRHDTQKKIRFASLQSEYGQKLLLNSEIDSNTTDSIVLIADGHYYTRSTAALKVLQILGGRWRAFYFLIIIPSILRDKVYDLIAKNRYRWFGKSDECMMPTDELRERFL